MNAIQHILAPTNLSAAPDRAPGEARTHADPRGGRR